MDVLWWIILLCTAAGIVGVLAAALFLLLPERARERTLPHMISFAVGALLGAAFLVLLPRAVEEAGDVHRLGAAMLAGLLGFFLLEKLLLWRHCHRNTCDAHMPQTHAAGPLVLFGDGLHNFVDGVLIGAAVLIEPSLGVVTTLAVLAHELPQELGDFAILLHSGFGRARALWFNMLSGLATLAGGLVAYAGLSGSGGWLPLVLAVAASSFIYIATTDLLPGLHRRIGPRPALEQGALVLAGIAVIQVAHWVAH